MTSAAARTPHRSALLAQQLTTLLGEAAPAAMAFLQQHLQWLELAGGEVLMEQGAPGDSAYLCVSGRLRVYVRDGEGAQRMVRELSRGEVIGEMSLYTREPRTATVIALHKTVLVNSTSSILMNCSLSARRSRLPSHARSFAACRPSICGFRCQRRSRLACYR